MAHLLPVRSDGGDGDDAQALFLVEIVAPGLRTGGALRLAGALQRAAARLTVAGSPVVWRGGLFVPAQSRCLSLLDADSVLAVRRARDVAGLATATVHRVTPLLAPVLLEPKELPCPPPAQPASGHQDPPALGGPSDSTRSQPSR